MSDESQTTNDTTDRQDDCIPFMPMFTSGANEIGLLMQILQELKVLNYQIGVLCKDQKP